MPFRPGISSKVNVIERLEFELITTMSQSSTLATSSGGPYYDLRIVIRMNKIR